MSKFRLFNTSALIDEIGQNPIGDDVAFKYLLGHIIFWSSAFYYGTIVGTFPFSLFLLEWVIVLLIAFAGTRHVFITNGREAGSHFLGRFICLSLPIAIKVFVLAEIALRLFYMILFQFLYPTVFSDPLMVRNLASFAWFPVAGILFFWRLSVAFVKLTEGHSPNKGFNTDAGKAGAG